MYVINRSTMVKVKALGLLVVQYFTVCIEHQNSHENMRPCIATPVGHAPVELKKTAFVEGNMLL